MFNGLRSRLSLFIEKESHRPDFNRAVRSTAAIMVPLVLGTAGHLPVETTFAVLTAQNIAMIDVRGSYSLRFTLLLAMIAVLAGAAGLGGLAAPSLAGAILATGFIALGSGLWRHLSSDYGPSLAVSSTLLFTIALSGQGDPAIAGRHELATLVGGLFGLLLQVGLWPFHAQHHLRRAVSDSWLALSEIPLAMGPDAPDADRQARVASAEAGMRTALEAAYAELEPVIASGRQREIAARLNALNRAAGRLATQIGTLNGALEMSVARPDFARLAPSFQPALLAFANTSRTVALAVVSRQPGHLAAFDVRQRRLTNLLRVLELRTQAQVANSVDGAHLAEILRQLGRSLEELGPILRSTIERAGERAAFSLELFDLTRGKLRPLASALNLAPKPDPALVRYTARIAVLTMVGVVAMKLLKLHHGYWLPFTSVVVLQPDYGSTRRKALQRVLGTLGGSILASALLWLHPGHVMAMVSVAATCFAFVYVLKRSYGIAVVFITLFVVVLTEASGGFDLSFALERLGTTTAGGLFALFAALLFWPAWEKDRFPPILARAIRANRDYLAILVERFAGGRAYDAEAIRAKRAAEAANTHVFSSLQRLNGDPKNRQDRIERAAALANGNQRLTRALNAITLHLEAGPPFTDVELGEYARRSTEALDRLATVVEKSGDGREPPEAIQADLDILRLPDAPAAADDSIGRRQSWILSQLIRAGTELSAMLLAYN